MTTDFKISAPYIIVNLDDDYRNQQLEGWFKTIQEVPKQAVSMSVTQIMKSKDHMRYSISAKLMPSKIL